MIMRSFNHDGNNSTKTVSPRLMPDVQYVYIQQFAKCFLMFESPFIILKSIIFIFINSISMYWSSFKAFVGVIIILNGVYDIFGYAFEMFWRIKVNAGEITTIIIIIIPIKIQCNSNKIL